MFAPEIVGTSDLSVVIAFHACLALFVFFTAIHVGRRQAGVRRSLVVIVAGLLAGYSAYCWFDGSYANALGATVQRIGVFEGLLAFTLHFLIVWGIPYLLLFWVVKRRTLSRLKRKSESQATAHSPIPPLPKFVPPPLSVARRGPPLKGTESPRLRFAGFFFGVIVVFLIVLVFFKLSSSRAHRQTREWADHWTERGIEAERLSAERIKQETMSAAARIAESRITDEMPPVVAPATPTPPPSLPPERPTVHKGAVYWSVVGSPRTSEELALNTAMNVGRSQLLDILRAYATSPTWTVGMEDLMERHIYKGKHIQKVERGEPDFPKGTVLYTARLNLELDAKHRDQLIQLARVQEAGDRQWYAVFGLFGTLGLLGAVVGYLRFQQFTLGRYSGIIKVGLAAVVAVALGAGFLLL